MKILRWILKSVGPRRIGLVLMGVYAAWLVLLYRYHFIDNINLLIHEAGHLLLGFFGELPSMLGGTVLQLAFPVAFVVHFWRRRQRLEAAVCSLWSAESLMYTAVYMGDANRLELPLIGGHIHDWRWMFERAGVLDSAEEIALAVRAAASMLAVAAVWYAVRLETSDPPGSNPDARP